ncbi:protein ORF23 [Anguillid herpesvirus 1]|nr:protein ORF23 [Anguillid herpesvirus 1]
MTSQSFTVSSCVTIPRLKSPKKRIKGQPLFSSFMRLGLSPPSPNSSGPIKKTRKRWSPFRRRKSDETFEIRPVRLAEPAMNHFNKIRRGPQTEKASIASMYSHGESDRLTATAGCVTASGSLPLTVEERNKTRWKVAAFLPTSTGSVRATRADHTIELSCHTFDTKEKFSYRNVDYMLEKREKFTADMMWSVQLPTELCWVQGVEYAGVCDEFFFVIHKLRATLTKLAELRCMSATWTSGEDLEFIAMSSLRSLEWIHSHGLLHNAIGPDSVVRSDFGVMLLGNLQWVNVTYEPTTECQRWYTKTADMSPFAAETAALIKMLISTLCVAKTVPVRNLKQRLESLLSLDNLTARNAASHLNRKQNAPICMFKINHKADPRLGHFKLMLGIAFNTNGSGAGDPDCPAPCPAKVSPPPPPTAQKLRNSARALALGLKEDELKCLPAGLLSDDEDEDSEPTSVQSSYFKVEYGMAQRRKAFYTFKTSFSRKSRTVGLSGQSYDRSFEAWDASGTEGWTMMVGTARESSRGHRVRIVSAETSTFNWSHAFVNHPGWNAPLRAVTMPDFDVLLVVQQTPVFGGGMTQIESRPWFYNWNPFKKLLACAAFLEASQFNWLVDVRHPNFAISENELPAGKDGVTTTWSFDSWAVCSTDGVKTLGSITFEPTKKSTDWKDLGKSLWSIFHAVTQPARALDWPNELVRCRTMLEGGATCLDYCKAVGLDFKGNDEFEFVYGNVNLIASFNTA